MNKLPSILWSCLAAFCLTAADDRPNILFIYTDDQSTRTVSAYPDAYPWVSTPHIDRLAGEGVLFKHAYIGSWCMPQTFAEGNRSRGTVVDTPMSGVDIPVTLYGLAGLRMPWYMHGNDLTPLLKDPAAKFNKPAVLVHTGQVYGSATGVLPGKDDPSLYHGPGVPWYVMVSLGRYKYVRYLVEGEMEELYDQVSDTEELRNLALEPEYSPLLRRYRRFAVKELRRTNAGFVDSLPTVSTR